MMIKPELLAPAGNLEKLQIAIAYGADAVYLGGESFGLRAMAGNFSMEELKRAVVYAHEKRVKLYVTLNVFPHNQHLSDLPDYVEQLRNINVDAFIISDPGVFSIVRQIAPEIDIHISTQANTLNWAAAEFWKKQGAARVILARELSVVEIAEIKELTDIELEAFVHGAMCISYSGRCYLSHYLTGRDANLGSCTQPCRWAYAIMEENRPGQYFPIEADSHGTYIMNSKDLCLIQHIPELLNAGLASLKIEGRMKSVHYVATVTKVYREAIDQYIANPSSFVVKEEWIQELLKASNREFTTGFYLGNDKWDDSGVNYTGYMRSYDFVGIVIDYCQDSQAVIVEQRNHIKQGDVLEVLSPFSQPFEIEVRSMKDMDGSAILAAPHPQMHFTFHSPKPLHPYDLLRRKNG